MQETIHHALPVADAVVLVDNSRDTARAFTPCYASEADEVLYDLRAARRRHSDRSDHVVGRRGANLRDSDRAGPHFTG